MKKAKFLQYHYLPAILWLCKPSTGLKAQDGRVRVPSTHLLLGLHETSMLWLRGLTWGVARGLLHSEHKRASAVIPPQDFLCAPSTCGTCPTDAPSGIFLPGSQVLLEISAFDCRSPERDLQPFVCSNKIYFFFFNLQLYLKHVTCLWLLTKYSVFWFCDWTFLLLAAPADAALSANFSSSDFSSHVIDYILESGAQNCSLWEATENLWCQQADLHFASGDFLFLYHTECVACWLHITSFVLYSIKSVVLWETRCINLVIFLQKEIKFGNLVYQLLWNYKHQIDFSSFYSWTFNYSLPFSISSLRNEQ